MAAFYQENYVPNKVIVDVTTPVDTFFRDTSNMNDHEYGIDFTIVNCLMYIADLSVSEQAIFDLGDITRRALIQAGKFIDLDINALATMQLARGLREAFVSQGLYTREGLLPYVFDKWLDSSCHAMILRSSTRQH